MSGTANPQRGEIWWVRLEPGVEGAEMNKTRPAVVVSSDANGVLPVRIVVPVTEWDDKYAHKPWHAQLLPDLKNQLKKTSSADTLALRSVSLARFEGMIGRVESKDLQRIEAALRVVLRLGSSG